MGRGRGILYIVSAPSGGGKTSLCHALASQVPGLSISVSYTTRPARPGEVNGENYHFIEEDTFKKLIQEAEFLEYARVFGHFYGTSRRMVETHLASGNDVILEIDWQGGEQVRKIFPDCVSVFIVPPSLGSLEQRLLDRQQDSKEVIQKRLEEARREISHYPEYDYLIINDDFQKALGQLQAIVFAERNRMVRQSHLHDVLLRGLLG